MKQDIKQKISEQIIYDLFHENEINDFYMRLIELGYIGASSIADVARENFKTRARYGNKADKIILKKFVERIIKIGNPEIIYPVAIQIQHEQKELINPLADAILKTNDIDKICNFAIRIHESPIDKFYDIVISTGNAEYISSYLNNLLKREDTYSLNAKIDMLIDALIATKDFEVITDTIIDDADTRLYGKLLDAVIDTKNASLIWSLAYPNYQICLDKLADGLINAGDLSYIVSFYEEYPNVKKEEIMQEIIKSENAKYILKYAIKAKDNVDVSKLADAIIKTEDYSRIVTFAIQVPNAPIDKLIDAIIKSGNSYEIYHIAMGCEKKYINKLADAIIETGDLIYIYRFAREVKGAPVDKLFNAIKKLI